MLSAPRLADSSGEVALTLLASSDGTAKSHFGPTDTLVVSGGLTSGLEVGQLYLVQRLVPVPTASRPILHTSGWVKIVETEREAATAEIVGACDSVQRGDFLKPFAWPDPVEVLPRGAPDFEHSGRILTALDGRLFIAEYEYFVLSLGEADDIARGQRFTIYRFTVDGAGVLNELGEAVAVRVDATSTTARVTDLTDLVEVGDLVAPQR